MLYGIGNKFLVDGILSEVRYINNNKAFVCPVEDTPGEHGRMMLRCVVFDVLDEKGRSKSGCKAIPVNESPSGAV